MADKSHYNTDIKVPQSVINEIQQLGMEGALKKARSGQASPEFVEGVSRFYPNDWRDEDKDQHLTQSPIPERVEAPDSQGGGPVSSPSSAPSGRASSGGLSADAISRRMEPKVDGIGPPNPDNAIESSPIPGTNSGGAPVGGPANSAANVTARNAANRPEDGIIRKLLEAAQANSSSVGGPSRGPRGRMR